MLLAAANVTAVVVPVEGVSALTFGTGWSIYDKIKLKRDPNKTEADAPFMTLGMQCFCFSMCIATACPALVL